jgi:O-antigen/teichoic acid export membrane protein
MIVARLVTHRWGTESLSTPASTSPSRPPLPPVLGRLLRGSFWLALRSPLQALFALWSVPLILKALGDKLNGAYLFAWGFGFVQFLLEFGMSSALQREVSHAWTRGDREGVDRAVACGTSFYAAISVVQAAILLSVAYIVLPFSFYIRGTPEYSLIVKLLWLQAITAPCFGLSVVVSSVLQAARRYDFVPRLELIIVVLRFLVLVIGLKAKVDFVQIVAAQVAVQVGLSLGPALWVMTRELGHRPHFQGARWQDYQALLHISFYVFAIQLSVVLADKLDTTILGFALRDPGPGTTIYNNVGKAFMQIRQTGWMLSYLVMPAVASLAAARDHIGLERIKYDGSRLLVGLLLPVALLAGLYAKPFLAWWVGPQYGAHASLMQLFLLATLPLIIAVLVQMSIGLGKVEVIAIAALAGSVVNLPLSYFLTVRIGVAGVIWGTVATTLISNLLVPGIYVFRVLEINPLTFATRTLGPPIAGAAILFVAAWLIAPHVPGALMSVRGALGNTHNLMPTVSKQVAKLDETLALVGQLAIGCIAYGVGYVSLPEGRSDARVLVDKALGRRSSGST